MPLGSRGSAAGDPSDDTGPGQSEDRAAGREPVQLALVSGLETKATSGQPNEPPPPASMLPFALHRARWEPGDAWELVSPGLLAEMAKTAATGRADESPSRGPSPGSAPSAKRPAEPAPEPVATVQSKPGAPRQAEPSTMAAAPAPAEDAAWRVGLNTLPTARTAWPGRWIGLLAAACLLIAAIAWWSFESRTTDSEAVSGAADSGLGPAEPVVPPVVPPGVPSVVSPGVPPVVPPAKPGGQDTRDVPKEAGAAPAPGPAESPPGGPTAAAQPGAAQPGATGGPDAVTAPSVDLVRIEPNGEAVIAGRAAPRSELIVLDNGEPIGTVKADAFGEWVFVPNTPLTQGGHEFGLVLKSEQGKVSIPAAPNGGDRSSAPARTPAPTPAATETRDGAELRNGEDRPLAPLPSRKPLASARGTDLSAPIPERKPSFSPSLDQSSGVGSSNADFVVQLASVKTRDGARREWQKLRRRFPEVLAGMDLSLHETKLAQRGTVIRVRTGPFSALDEAAEFCARIRAGRQDCLIVRANFDN